MKNLNFKDLIVFEDNDFCIINKPPGISTLEDRADSMNILALARDYDKDAQVGHRLDKETSGVMVITKNPEAYRHFQLELQHRRVDKIYHAVVNDNHEIDGIKIEMPLMSPSKGVARIDFGKGKPAETLVKTGEIFKKHTLLECKPVTGRTHQIRAHLSAIKAPIVMDEKYGGAPAYLSELKKRFNMKKDEDERPMIQRVALHAYAISFQHLNGTKLEATAPYPKDFAVLVKQLKKYK